MKYRIIPHCLHYQRCLCTPSASGLKIEMKESKASERKKTQTGFIFHLLFLCTLFISSSCSTGVGTGDRSVSRLSFTDAGVKYTEIGRLPLKSTRVCIFIPPLFLRNLAHGHNLRHRLMVLLSKAYTILLRSNRKLS